MPDPALPQAASLLLNLLKQIWMSEQAGYHIHPMELLNALLIAAEFGSVSHPSAQLDHCRYRYILRHLVFFPSVQQHVSKIAVLFHTNGGRECASACAAHGRTSR